MRHALFILTALLVLLFEGKTNPWMTVEPFWMHLAGQPESTLASQPTVEITVIHDDSAPRIVLRSWFYAAQNSPEERRQMQAAIRFWNDQSGRFGYRLGRGRQAKVYRLHFQLAEAAGHYDENNFFIPVANTNLHSLNQVQVVADQALARVPASSPQRVVAGYAPQNFVYIAASHSDNLMVGIHEIGHRLGAGHAAGVMHCALDHPTSHVARQTIREILATAGIIGKGKQALQLARHFRARGVQLAIEGRPPAGLYREGQISRLR